MIVPCAKLGSPVPQIFPTHRPLVPYTHRTDSQLWLFKCQRVKKTACLCSRVCGRPPRSDCACSLVHRLTSCSALCRRFTTDQKRYAVLWSLWCATPVFVPLRDH